MKIKKNSLYIAPVLMLLFCMSTFGQVTIVEKYGQLSVKGPYLMGQNGDTVQLRGMSFFWHQWMGQYYNSGTVKWLRDDWKCTVVRAAIGADNGGFIEQPFEAKDKLKMVVKAAIEYGVYVIIDYHSHQAHTDVASAKKFFTEVAQKYGNYPNVIYEIYNEPLDVSWSEDLKPYSEEIIKTIRQYDPDNIIICGTRQWSQMTSEAAADPIRQPNIMYTLHFYAGSHGQLLRDDAKSAIEKGLPIFVTEYGTCEASGNGNLSLDSTRVWFDFLDKYKISHCNWAISDKEETASILIFGASWSGPWKESKLTPSGLFVRKEMIEKNGPLLKTVSEK